MDTSVRLDKKPNPVERANFLSMMTFFYMLKIFKKTFKHDLTEEDLFRPLLEHKSSHLGEKLEKEWRKQYKIHKKYALHWALFKLFGLQFVFLGILKLINEIILVVIMPLSIGRLISYFEKDQVEISKSDAYFSAGAVILCLLFNNFLDHPCMMGMMHITMKMRVACSSLVYRKTLRLSRNALASTTIGQLVNLLSNDVSKFDQGFLTAHLSWIAPIQTAIGTYLIYREIGVAALLGMVLLISIIPIQIWLGRRMAVLRHKTALRTDERVRLMNEIISAIQVIKMYCWEKPFAQLISIVRKKEMNAIRSTVLLLGFVCSFGMFLTRTAVFVSVLGYVLLGSFITAKKVFAITAIYNVLRPMITILFSVSITSIAQCNVSVLRIQKFLSYEETEPQEMIKVVQNGSEKKNCTALYNNKMKPRILLQNVSAKWLRESPENTLKNIDLNINLNEVVAVIGPVGSGKSSIFNVILKELPILEGKMEIRGEISYSSQEPWLFSASVRQNILFGSDFDEVRYEKVCEVCALKSDFQLLPYGDRTLVGERGKTLSGGQKARVNLARCIYKNADIYLLDDPLSAVDANVGKHLYEKCIKEFLSDKICILITHQLQYVRTADKIVIMKDGSIETQGDYKELQSSGLDFAKLCKQFHNEDDDDEKDKKKGRQNSESQAEEALDNDNDNNAPNIEKEQMMSGHVKASLYLTYFRSGGNIFMLVLLVAFFIIGQIIANSADYYIANWVNLEQDYTDAYKIINVTHRSEYNNTTADSDSIIVQSDATPSTLDRNTIIYTYSGIIFGTILFAIVHSLHHLFYFVLASINLHKISFNSIINASMRFFNLNPSGRILNRFSKDLGSIDEYVPRVLFDVIDIFLQLLGTFIISLIVDPFLSIPTLLLIIVFYLCRVVYMRTSRCVKRLEGIKKSPIFTHMTASMHGLSTIRAFSAQEILIEEFDNYQDDHSAAWFLFLASNRCFAKWLDVICITFMAFAMFILLYFKNTIYGGDIGLIITQYLGLIGALQWGMRQWSELENHMISVERLLEYKKVDSEPHREKIKNLPKLWPNEGKIEFKSVSLRYSQDDPPVLKNLNFVIEPREKIGIVGRTGAGKSSTIIALFQLYPIEGTILIDDIDTTKLPLDELRSKISIIPQDPVLFSGTMRKNLDPFDEFSDETLWNSLEQVQLKETISELLFGLHSNVSEGGSNFSVGQRQLVCLARALIRNNKILVMDEATANVDPKTDSLIQETIREKFADCTVLTIAHRLHTVMDCDRILVMNEGRVVEFDHPYKLLQNEEGIFFNSVQYTGKSGAENLKELAKKSYDKIRKYTD